MKIAESILELFLLIIPLIIKGVADKKAAIIKFRKIFDEIEKKNISAELSESADNQLEELKNGTTVGENPTNR